MLLIICFSRNTNALEVVNWKCFIKSHSEILTWFPFAEAIFESFEITYLNQQFFYQCS